MYQGYEVAGNILHDQVTVIFYAPYEEWDELEKSKEWREFVDSLEKCQEKYVPKRKGAAEYQGASLRHREEVKPSQPEKKNPHFPAWKTWILISLIVSQILTSVQIQQSNAELWKAVIQLGDHLRDHLDNEIQYNEAMSQLLEEENQLLEECNRKLEDFLN